MKQRTSTTILAGICVALLAGITTACSGGAQPEQAQAKADAKQTLYQCPMHPDVTSHEPGDCPICGMRLVPVDSGGDTSAEQGDADCKVAYWVAPMDPNYRSDKPGKSPMGMDLVPVCEEDLGGASDVENRVSVKISAHRIQQLGIRLSPTQLTDAAVRVIRTPGTVSVDEQRVHHVHTRVRGWIERVNVQSLGDPVQRGQILYELYSPDLVATQEELLSALAGGNASAADGARRRLRYWNVAERDIRAIEHKRQVLRRIPFRSPIDGYVHKLMAVEGMYVEARTELYTLVDLSQVWVRAHFYENEIDLLQPGASATIVLSDGDEVAGTLEYVYPSVDARTRYVDARLVFPNPDLKLRPEMYVDVRYRVDLGPALIAPRDAVLRTGRQNVAFVHLGNGRFEPRALELGPEVEGGVIVYDGLDEDEMVADQAAFFIDSESALKAALAKFRPGASGGGHEGH